MAVEVDDVGCRVGCVVFLFVEFRFAFAVGAGGVGVVFGAVVGVGSAAV